MVYGLHWYQCHGLCKYQRSFEIKRSNSWSWMCMVWYNHSLTSVRAPAKITTTMLISLYLSHECNQRPSSKLWPWLKIHLTLLWARYYFCNLRISDPFVHLALVSSILRSVTDFFYHLKITLINRKIKCPSQERRRITPLRSMFLELIKSDLSLCIIYLK